MGPETLSEFILQRRRNYAGHLHLVRKYGYRVSSLESGRVLRIAIDEVAKALRLIWTLCALALIEAFVAHSALTITISKVISMLCGILPGPRRK